MVRLEDSGSSLFIVFMIKKDWLDDLSQAKDRSFRFPSPRVLISDALRRSCWRVLDLMISAGAGREQVDKEVERLLEAAIAASTTGADAAPVPGGIGVTLDHRLRAAIAHMRTHVSEKTSIDEIAAKVGLSRAHFFALFHRCTGVTPNVYLNVLRMETAINDLSAGAHSLTDISYDLGFSAPAHFTRFFKQNLGITPSEYRRVVQLYEADSRQVQI